MSKIKDMPCSISDGPHSPDCDDWTHADSVWHETDFRAEFARAIDAIVEDNKALRDVKPKL